MKFSRIVETMGCSTTSPAPLMYPLTASDFAAFFVVRFLGAIFSASSAYVKIVDVFAAVLNDVVFARLQVVADEYVKNFRCLRGIVGHDFY